MLHFRLACPADGAALVALYAAYIDTAITFEYDLPSADAFSARIADTLRTYPYLVCEEDGVPVGYAYAHPYRARAAYQWGAELSVYLAPHAAGRGIGTRLYALLLNILRAQGVKTVYGCVTLPNPASERLHEALGFSRIGVYHGAGFKSGRWHDTVWFERLLAPLDSAPAPIIPISDLPDLDRLLARAGDPV